MLKTQTPVGLQAVLWSRDLTNLDINNDKHYIINQVLAYGFMEHLKWLFKTYPKEVLNKTFIEKPVKIYSPKSFNFIKFLLFGSKNVDLDEQKYVQNSL
jgi:hypothetical protein